jgi:rhodanese-related sulfurtransferase
MRHPGGPVAAFASMEEFLAFLQRSPMNLILFATAVVSGGMLIWPLIARLTRRGSEIGPLEAVQLINREDAAVIDVRDIAEFKAGHITNARNIPEARVEERLKELDKLKSRPIIVSCARGNRSVAVAARLRKLGFERALSLRGGLGAWQQAGMPLEKS